MFEYHGVNLIYVFLEITKYTMSIHRCNFGTNKSQNN